VGERTSVLLADDHPVYLDGLAGAVAADPGLELVASCGDGREALERIRELEPDVAALDLMLPTLTATAVLQELDGGTGTGTRVLVLSAYAEAQAVFDAIQAGARGYIPKSWPRARICDAIGTVAAGHTVFAEEVQDGIGEEIRRRGAVAQERLTTRDREILNLLAEGLTSPQIAKRLYLSVSTIKTHQHSLYEKLGVADRAAAVAAAMRRGLIR
jgi:two-component system, NarL family, nitrate/nitrite response regulator NarL